MGVHWANWHLILGNFASKNKNRELVRPFRDVLRIQNHLQSSWSMSFVARSDQLSAQLRLSFEIGGFCGLDQLPRPLVGCWLAGMIELDKAQFHTNIQKWVRVRVFGGLLGI